MRKTIIDDQEVSVLNPDFCPFITYDRYDEPSCQYKRIVLAKNEYYCNFKNDCPLKEVKK